MKLLYTNYCLISFTLHYGTIYVLNNEENHDESGSEYLQNMAYIWIYPS